MLERVAGVNKYIRFPSACRGTAILLTTLPILPGMQGA